MIFLPGTRIKLRILGETIQGTVHDWTDERTLLVVTDQGVDLHVNVTSVEALARSPKKPLDS